MSERVRALVELGAATERGEHVASVLRMRRACVVAVILWPAFGVLDWFIVRYVEPGRLWYFLLLRAIGLVALGVAVLMLFSPRLPGRRLLRVVEPILTTLLAVLVTLDCVEFRGIDSPLATGVVVIILGRASVLAQHWRQALPTLGAIGLSFPLTLLVAAQVSPSLAAEFHRRADLGGFAVSLSFILGSAAIAVYGGHVVWSLRRQVFESRSLGRYRLERRIGKGGMGEVWIAHHHALRRDVAVKIILPDDQRDPAAIARFEREVRTTAELCHPNTVRVFDHGVTEDGICYYAMELLHGQELAERVAERGIPPLPQATRFAWQAARALGEAHSRGIIHRDVKPENLFVATVGNEELIKLLDFGLAKLAVDTAPALTATGWTVGTPRYVAPEVIRGRPADTRTDVYALGGVLYFMVTGAPPFDLGEVGALLAAHLEAPVERPSLRLGRPLPARLEAIILRCLEKDPDRRFADGNALAAALEQSFAAAVEASGAGSEVAITTEIECRPDQGEVG